MSELFAMNAPDPHHWTLNSCFVAFRKVWVHLGSFRYCTRLTRCKMGRTSLINAKVQATKSRQNLSRHGTLNSCFVAFRKVWVHLGRFITALNSVKMSQSVAINAKVRAMKSRLNLSLRTRPIHTNGP